MELLEQKHLALLREAERRGVESIDNLRACFELLALAGAIDRGCADRLSPHRLSEGKFVLLFLLHGHPDGLSPHELADRAGVTRATITGLLDGLERDGFITRRSDLEDRRKITIVLTNTGRKTARELFNEHATWVATLFTGFTAKERKILTGLLHRVWRNLDRSTAYSAGPNAQREFDQIQGCDVKDIKVSGDRASRPRTAARRRD